MDVWPLSKIKPGSRDVFPESISMLIEADLKFSDKFRLNAALTINNVFVLTQYSGMDPEVVGGIDNNIYPRPRIYSLNLTFDF